MVVRIHPPEQVDSYSEALLALLVQAALPQITDALAQAGSAPCAAQAKQSA